MILMANYLSNPLLWASVNATLISSSLLAQQMHLLPLNKEGLEVQNVIESLSPEYTYNVRKQLSLYL